MTRVNHIENKHDPGRQELQDENMALGATSLAVLWLGLGAAEVAIGAHLGGLVGASIGGIIYLIQTGAAGAYVLSRQ